MENEQSKSRMGQFYSRVSAWARESQISFPRFEDWPPLSRAYEFLRHEGKCPVRILYTALPDEHWHTPVLYMLDAVSYGSPDWGISRNVDLESVLLATDEYCDRSYARVKTKPLPRHFHRLLPTVDFSDPVLKPISNMGRWQTFGFAPVLYHRVSAAQSVDAMLGETVSFLEYAYCTWESYNAYLGTPFKPIRRNRYKQRHPHD